MKYISLFNEDVAKKLKVCNDSIATSRSERSNKNAIERYSPPAFPTGSSIGTKRKNSGTKETESERSMKSLKKVTVPKSCKKIIDADKNLNQTLDDFVKSSAKTIFNTGIDQIYILKYLQEKLSQEMEKKENRLETRK